VINKKDERVAERALFYENNGTDMMKLANDKRKSNELTTIKERSAYFREQLFLYSRNVYSESNPKHTAKKGAPWLVTNFPSSHFPTDIIFNAYDKSKGTWFEMSVDHFNQLNMCDDEGRKAWLEKIHVKFNTWDIKFSALNMCDSGGNVFGNLITRKPEVIFTAVVDGDVVRHAIIHDEHGLDLRKFALSKEKDGAFNSYPVRGMFQREVLNISAMSVYDSNNDYHTKYDSDGKPAKWFTNSFDGTNLHTENLFEAYKSSKGEWFKMDAKDFQGNNLCVEASQKVWIDKFSEKYEDWNIKFKVHMC